MIVKNSSLSVDTEKLRKKILDLAMRGKLIPQDSQDEPASVLLEKIKEEKAQLIKEKKIKKSKPLPEITEEEKPFEIPESWEWVRLGEILDVRDGTHDTPKYLDSGVPLITAKNLDNGSIDFNNVNYISFEDAKKINQRSKVDKDDIIFAMIGTIGNPVLVQEEYSMAIKNVALLKKIYYLNMKYILRCIQFSENRMYKKSNGGNQKFISLKKIREFTIPLPPLAEQKRIVAKVEECMQAIKTIEDSSKEYEKLENQLDKKVLDLAMRGKLVPQDSQDEPASVLLEKIKEEKAQLIKEKKIKKSKLLGLQDIDVKIPDTWELTQLGDICEIKGGKRVPKGKKLYKSGVKVYIRVSDMKKGSIDLKDLQYVDEETLESIKNYTISSKDLYFSIAGTIGKVGKVPENLGGALLTENAAKLVLIRENDVLKEYIYYCLQSEFIKEQCDKIVSQVAQPKLSLIKLRSLAIPLPPLAEQECIVAKIEEIKQYLKS
ncbi:restriction endonuclease subunit S [Ligilactobacillus salivarius]|uniref:restriction endonuclease subunit S n=1 Tax=Ligilactobacillus salivarius TaxID=1624 RepID=UPI000BAF824A|nr:restriction endonuclease subunit S [Ligilactobacillus salivarius]